MEDLRMKNEIDKKLLKYIPKKKQNHIIALYRQCGKISFVMEWEDGFQRSRIADKKQFSPSGLFCNAAVDGSKPVKMQRTEKQKKEGILL